MEKLIVGYLFRHQYCPLGKLGCLELVQMPAQTDISAHSILAPENEIILTPRDCPAQEFLEYVSRSLGVSIEKASGALADYCDNLSRIDAYEEVVLPAAGKFYVDADGNLQFKSSPLPPAYYPPVPAQRVIHPQAVHQMLVGDKETDTGTMSAFFNDAPGDLKGKWWIASLIILIISLLAIGWYFMSASANATGGNQSGIDTYQPDSSFRPLP